MNFCAIVLALALEQWRSLAWRTQIQRGYQKYARNVERRLNAGSMQQGIVALLVALVPPVVIAALVYWGLDRVHPLLALVWQVAILYLLVGFRPFSHAFSAIAAALRNGDAISARKRLAAWRGVGASYVTAEEVPKLCIEQGVMDSYRHVFATLFWFLLLPGPSGALLYRAAVVLADQWSGDAATPMGRQLAQFGRPARELLYALDWVPVRLTALTFAIVGDFEDAIYCWRTQARQWTAIHEGILLASAGGALGIVIGGVMTGPGEEPEFRPELGIGDPADADVLPSATGLIWRALLVWLALLLVLTIAYWSP